MSNLLFQFPRSSSARLAEAIELAKRFPGFTELGNAFEVRPTALDVQHDSFQNLLKIAGRWKGATFLENDRACTLSEFKGIGLRIGDPILKNTPDDWKESFDWYGWEFPQRLLIPPDDDEFLHRFFPRCEENTPAWPVDVEISKNPILRESFPNLTAFEAKMDGNLVGHLWPTNAEAILRMVNDPPVTRYAGVWARRPGQMALVYVWPERVLSDGIRIQAHGERTEVVFTDVLSTCHNFARWKLKFPDRKEPIDRFEDRIRADLEGRKLEPLPSSIKARERRQRKKAEEAERRQSEARQAEPKGCGSQAAAMLAMAWLFKLLTVNFRNFCG